MKKQIIIIITIISLLIVVGSILILAKISQKTERNKLTEFLKDMNYTYYYGTYYEELKGTYEEYINHRRNNLPYDYWFKGITINNLEYVEQFNDTNITTTYSYKYNYQTDIASGYYAYSTIDGNNYYYSLLYNFKSGTSECVLKSNGIEIGKCAISSEFSGQKLMNTKKEFLQIINFAKVNLDNYFHY